MALPAAKGLKGSQIKAEFLQSSMKSAGSLAGLTPPFRMSQFAGKTFANWMITPGNNQNLSFGYLAANKIGSVQRNSIGGNFAGVTMFAGLKGNYTMLTLNNWRQGSYSFYLTNNKTTYNFVKMPNNTNTYYCTNTALSGVLAANVGKRLDFLVTPH